MTRKNIQIIAVLIIGVISGFLGGYLFRQSAKLKQVSKPSPPRQPSVIKQIHKNNKVEEKSKIFKKKIVVGSLEKQQVKSKNNSSNGPSISQFKKWLDEYVVTPYFIQDVVSYILDSYEPAMTQENPTDQPRLNLSLKGINARYGLELIGFRVQAPTLEKARKKVLTQIMDTTLLKKQYEHYSQIFINELIEQAGETQKKFLVNGKIEQRTLNKQEIKDLLMLLSKYISDLSNILQTVSQNQSILEKLQAFLDAEQSSMHENYVLSQIMNKYNLKKSQIHEHNSTGIQELKSLEKERQKAIKDYEISIKRREQLRKEIISYILNKNPNIKFSTSEILYVCEWIHRRIQANVSPTDIQEIGNILDQLSEKLQEKAQGLL